MKNVTLPIATLVGALLLSPAVSASPLTVTIAGGNWNLDSGWGAACATSACDTTHSKLNVDWSVSAALAGTGLSFVNLGDTQTITLGTARFAEEDGTIAAGENSNLGLDFVLNFSSPSSLAAHGVGTGTATLGALKDRGNPVVDLSVDFAPVVIDFASGAEITMLIDSQSWNCQGTDHCTFAFPDENTIQAKFTLTAIPSESLAFAATVLAVPEPSSVLLLGVGMTGLWLGKRRRG